MADWTNVTALGPCRWDVYRYLPSDPEGFRLIPPSEYDSAGITVTVVDGLGTVEFPDPGNGGGNYELYCVPLFELDEPRAPARLLAVSGDSLTGGMLRDAENDTSALTPITGSVVDLNAEDVVWTDIGVLAEVPGV